MNVFFQKWLLSLQLASALILSLFMQELESARRLRSPKQLVNLCEQYNDKALEESDGGNTVIVEKKVFTHKLQYYFKAVECLEDVDLLDKANELNTINSTLFWYRISSQYYYFDYIPIHRREQIKNQAINDIRERYLAIQLPNNLQKKRNNPKTSPEEFLLPFETSQMKEKCQKLSIFLAHSINSEWNYFQKIQPIPVKQAETPTTKPEDERFISSIRAILFNIIKRKIRTKPCYRVVQTYLQAVNLTNTKISSRQTMGQFVNNSSSEIQNIEDDGYCSQEQSKIQQSLISDLPYENQITADHILLSVIMNLQIQFLIRLLENNLPQYAFPEISSQSDIQFYSDFGDTLNFVATSPKEETQICEILKQNQQYDKLEEQHIDHKSLCQICFTDIFSLHNPKITCFYCKISAHMKCIMLQQKPILQIWICQVCDSFGAAGINLCCALCPTIGGVMKRCNFMAKSYRCEQFNPHYSQYLKSHKWQDSSPDKSINRHTQQNCTPIPYNYYDKSTHTSEQPYVRHLWAHYSCISFTDQCSFSEQKGSIVCEGIDKIPAYRFQSRCQICGKADGVTVECAESECKRCFHAECAGRRLLIIEDFSQIRSYLTVFCPQHRPPKSQQTMQLKHRNSRQQIQMYARDIITSVGESEFLRRMYHRAEMKQLQAYIDDESFSVKKNIKKLSKKIVRDQMTPNRSERNQSPKDSKGQQIYYEDSKSNERKGQLGGINDTPKNQQSALAKTESKRKAVKNGKDNEQGKATKMQRNFHRLLMLSKHKDEVVVLQAKIRRINRKRQQKNKLKEQQIVPAADPTKPSQNRKKSSDKQAAVVKVQYEGSIRSKDKEGQKNAILYCVCQKPYEEKYPMLQCERCNEWFHFSCIGYIGSIKLAKKLRFICTMCLKIETKVSRKKIIATYLDLFKKQSNMYVEHKETFVSLEIEDRKASKPSHETAKRQESEKRKEGLLEDRSRSRNRK